MTAAEKAQKVIQIARYEIGVEENPPNSNKVKYNTWFYNKEVFGPSYPWCGTFVSWVFFKAGLSLGKIDYLRGFAGCPFAVNYYKGTGDIVTKENVKPGDIVFFDWQGDGKPDHTGIFVCDNGNGTFMCIEGNTAVGNDSNGGKVMLRERRYGSVKAFVHPKVYELAA